MTACISTMMVLIMIGAIVFFGAVADRLGRSVKENFTVEVLLDDSLTQKEAYQLQTELREMPYTKAVAYVSKEKATKSMAETFDTNPEEFIGNSPFPASFELHLNAEYANADSLNRFMPSLKQAVGVTDVIYPEDLMGQVNHNIQQVSMVLLVIAILLAIISIALINNTMRLSVAQRRHTIQTMKLVGANWSFIRRPFIRRALWMGILAAVLADVVLAAGMSTFLQWEPDAADIISPLVMVVTLGSVLVIGVALTLICAFFSVNRHLGMSRDEAALY